MLISPQSLAPNEREISEFINIEQENIKYLLTIKINGKNMLFILSDKEDCFDYLRKMTLQELKEKENCQIFSGLKSCKEFSDYLKALSEEKKLSIIKKNDKLSINFIVEYLLKKHSVEIDLFDKKKNDDYLKEKIKNLENENKKLKYDVEYLKKENINLKNEIEEIKKIIEQINSNIKINNINIDSVIINNNEFNFIYNTIKYKLKKEIKEVKKLYQATIDGDDLKYFHSRCDNIPNTLTIIKSAGNRRFGGFTTQVWESPKDGFYKDDKNAFLFSIDKQKIYPYKNDGYAIWCGRNGGPTFGIGDNFSSIYIGKNPINKKRLFTNESNINKCSYNFFGDKNALSEDGEQKGIYAVEYEVFEIIFT